MSVGADGAIYLLADMNRTRVYRLAPGGSWSTIAVPYLSTAEVLLAHPRQPNELFVGSRNANVLLHSTDGGENWERSFTPSSQTIHAIAIDPADPNTLYFAGSTLVMKSTDRGNTLVAISSGQFTPLGQISVSPADRSVYVLASTAGGEQAVALSSDGGASWSTAPAPAKNITSLAVDVRDGRTVYVSSRSGIYRSTDAGLTWQAIHEGLPSPEGNDLALDVRGGRLYAAVEVLGVWELALSPRRRGTQRN